MVQGWTDVRTLCGPWVYPTARLSGFDVGNERKQSGAAAPHSKENMDNSERIAEIEALLETGAATNNVDGISTTIDRESLRRELGRLRENDDTARPKRPRAAGIYLGGF